MSIRHRFVSGKSDGGDATLVRPTNWNDTHAGALLPLDDITLDSSLGDDFDSPTIDAKWNTIGSIVANGWEIDNSTLLYHPVNFTNFGHYEACTDADEIDVTMKASHFGKEADEGFGPVILNSSNTGLWLGYRASSRLGIFTVTTGTTATEPSFNSGMAGAQFMANGEPRWWRLRKRKCGGVDLYFWDVSFDGHRWWTAPTAGSGAGGYDPTDFTPARVGWMQGVQLASSFDGRFGVHWFNATRKSLSANRLVTPSSGTVSASSNATSQTNSPSVVIDGNVANEWYFPNTNSAGVYWEATWTVAQTINRVRIRGRNDSWGSGRIELSDGTLKSFYGLGTTWVCVDFDVPVSTTQIKVYWHKLGHGANPGFQEIEAYLAS